MSTDQPITAIAAADVRVYYPGVSIIIAARNAAQAATASGRTMLVVATVLAFVLGAFLAISIIRYLTRALADAGALAAAVAEGDLTHTVDVKAQDEVGAMVTSLNRMTENLRRVVGDIAKMIGYPQGIRWRREHNPPDWKNI